MKKIYLKEDKLEKIKQILKKDFHSYVLLTCSSPSEKGEMQVEMVYQGEEALVSYLIDGAALAMEKQAIVREG